MKKKGKVFLLDDDGLIVSVLSRALKKEGYEVY
jgi:ActR/RegA family two-component response regulator